MARAKLRYVVVISHDFYNENAEFDEVVVLPTYTLKPGRPRFANAVRRGELPHIFYIAEDPAFPQMGECFIDFREVRPLRKGFLGAGKLDVAFTPLAVAAIVQSYKDYLSRELAD